MIPAGIWAAVCVKSLGAAKQRLAPVLGPDQRRRLVLAMMRDVLAALAAVPDLAGLMVISADRDVLALAAGANALCIVQDRDLGFAAAADAAARAAVGQASGVMIVPADVPLARPADFTAVMTAHTAGGLTIVPAWDGDGSNCVIVSPPAAMPFRFGPGSFGRHLAAADAAGLPVRIVRNARLAQDIDTPADYARLDAASCGPHLRRLLAAAPVLYAPARICAA